MLVNSSSNSNQSLVYYCSESKHRPIIMISIATVKAILILPLSTFILHMGYQRWRQQRSFNTASHSDLFAYHLAAMELFWGVAMVCFLCGLYCSSFPVIMMGFCSFALTFYAELFSHLLTCIERYLAVVHPVTYRGLRGTRGVRIRNVSIGCVWCLSCGLAVGFVDPSGDSVRISVFLFLALTIIAISFCSLSVLCVLIRPGPGEGGGGGEKQRDQSKRRAFYTITAISATQWVWFISQLAATAVDTPSILSEAASCVITACVGWFNLPSSLVSPLLFLHRAGKLPCSCFKCK